MENITTKRLSIIPGTENGIGLYSINLLENGEQIGIFSINDELNLSYFIYPEYESKGYCTEAVRSLTEAFLKENKRIIIHPITEQSEKIAMNCGYVQDPKDKICRINHIKDAKRYLEVISKIDEKKNAEKENSKEISK